MGWGLNFPNVFPPFEFLNVRPTRLMEVKNSSTWNKSVGINDVVFMNTHTPTPAVLRSRHGPLHFEISFLNFPFQSYLPVHKRQINLRAYAQSVSSSNSPQQQKIWWSPCSSHGLSPSSLLSTLSCSLSSHPLRLEGSLIATQCEINICSS